jgi:hypothetical protein
MRRTTPTRCDRIFLASHRRRRPRHRLSRRVPPPHHPGRPEPIGRQDDSDELLGAEQCAKARIGERPVRRTYAPRGTGERCARGRGPVRVADLGRPRRPLPAVHARLHNQFDQVHPLLESNGSAGRPFLNLTPVRLGSPVIVLEQQRGLPLLRAEGRPGRLRPVRRAAGPTAALTAAPQEGRPRLPGARTTLLSHACSGGTLDGGFLATGGSPLHLRRTNQRSAGWPRLC